MEDLTVKWNTVLENLGIKEENRKFAAEFAEHIMEKMTLASVEGIDSSSLIMNLYILSKLNLKDKKCKLSEHKSTIPNSSFKIKYKTSEYADIEKDYDIDINTHFESVIIEEITENINKILETKTTLNVDAFVLAIVNNQTEINDVSEIEVLSRYELN